MAEGHARPAGGSRPDRTFCSKTRLESVLGFTIIVPPSSFSRVRGSLMLLFVLEEWRGGVVKRVPLEDGVGIV